MKIFRMASAPVMALLILGLFSAGCATEPNGGDGHIAVVTSAINGNGYESGWIDSFDYGFESSLPSTWVPADVNVRGWACLDPSVGVNGDTTVNELAVYVGGPPSTGYLATNVAVTNENRPDLANVCINTSTSGFHLGFNWLDDHPRGVFYVTYTNQAAGGGTLLLGGAHH